MSARSELLSSIPTTEPRLGVLMTRGTIVDHLKQVSGATVEIGKKANRASIAAGLPDGSKITSKKGTPPKKKPEPKPIVIGTKATGIVARTFHPKGQFYDMEMSFSLGYQTHGVGDVSSVPVPALTAEEIDKEGLAYGNPLVNPHFSTQYNVMLKIIQTHQEPILTGFKLKWTRPTSSWKWTDGGGDVVNYAVTSNPAVLIRTIQTDNGGGSGVTAQVVGASFSVTVLKVYR